MSVAGTRLLFPHLFGCSLHCSYNFVIAGAAAEITGETITDLFHGRIGVAIKQCLGCNQETWRADAALQRSVFDELLLQRMKFVSI